MADAWCDDLKDTQIQSFQTQGFLKVGRITTDRELTWLRGVYDEIVRQKIGYNPHEIAKSQGRHATDALVTVFSPEKIIPALMQTFFAYNARRIVARLLDTEETRLRDEWRLVCKPARGGKTSWHQDAMYRVDLKFRPIPHEGAAVWMPLDQATIASGCLYYVRGSHIGELRPHRFQGDHVQTDEPDASETVPCPSSAGEAIFHHCRTLHGAGSNQTDEPRRALQIIFQVTVTAQEA